MRVAPLFFAISLLRAAPASAHTTGGTGLVLVTVHALSLGICLVALMIFPFARGYRVLAGFTCVAATGAADLMLSYGTFEGTVWFVIVFLALISVPWLAGFGVVAWARRTFEAQP